MMLQDTRCVFDTQVGSAVYFCLTYNCHVIYHIMVLVILTPPPPLQGRGASSALFSLNHDLELKLELVHARQSMSELSFVLT